jgi:hypothetical protein
MELLTLYLDNKYSDPTTPLISAQLAHRDLIAINLSFFGLLRRSDLAVLKPTDLQTDPSKDFALAHISKSKTD